MTFVAKIRRGQWKAITPRRSTRIPVYYPRNFNCINFEISMKIQARTLWLVRSRCGRWTFRIVSATEAPQKPNSLQPGFEANSEQMVTTTPATQPKVPSAAPTSPPGPIKASYTCPAVESMKPSLPLGQSRSIHDLRVPTGPLLPAQAHIPSPIRAIRPSPFVHDLSQYLRSDRSMIFERS